MSRLIGFVGKMGSGKTTAANYLELKHGFIRVAFADALKETAKKVTPDGRIDKVRDRELLQFLGTEYFRNKIDQEYWVKAFKKTTQFWMDRGTDVICDDVRFPNEAKAIRDLEGTLLYVSVPAEAQAYRLKERDGKVTKGISGHASEDVGMLRYACDDTLCNDGSLEDLERDLDFILHALTE